jgi:hypothetical protein
MVLFCAASGVFQRHFFWSVTAAPHVVVYSPCALTAISPAFVPV